MNQSNHPFEFYLSQLNTVFLSEKVKKAPGPTILQLGYPQLNLCDDVLSSSQYLIQESHLNSTITHIKKPDIVALTSHLPWANESIDTIIWPNGLDYVTHFSVELKEIHRVLSTKGQLIVTGLNKKGYWRLFYQKWAQQNKIQSHSVAEIITEAKKTFFLIQEGQFLGYQLPTKKQTPLKNNYLDLMGNRWWPDLAAMYALVFNKTTIYLRPDFETSQRLQVNHQLVLEPSANLIDK